MQTIFIWDPSGVFREEIAKELQKDFHVYSCAFIFWKRLKNFNQFRNCSIEPLSFHDLSPPFLSASRCPSSLNIHQPALIQNSPFFPPVNIHTKNDFGQTMVTEQKMLSSGSIFFRRKTRSQNQFLFGQAKMLPQRNLWKLQKYCMYFKDSKGRDRGAD